MMTEAKHTPGPWVYVNNLYSSDAIHGSCGRMVCHVFGDDAQAEEDARLIAAAPELLEALEALDDIYRDAQTKVPQHRVYAPEAFEEAWTQARAVIAKATGGEA